MVTSIPNVAPIKTDVAIRANGDTRTDTFIPFANQRVSLIRRSGSQSVLELLHGIKQFTESSSVVTTAQGDLRSAMAGATVQMLASETIAGYPCKHARIVPRGGGFPMEVWVTSQINGEGDAIADIDTTTRELLSANGLNGFPLKVVMAQQGIPITVETITVESRAVASSLFSAPADYTRIAQTEAGVGTQSPNDRAAVEAFAKQLQAAMQME